MLLEAKAGCGFLDIVSGPFTAAECVGEGEENGKMRDEPVDFCVEWKRDDDDVRHGIFRVITGFLLMPRQ